MFWCCWACLQLRTHGIPRILGLRLGRALGIVFNTLNESPITFKKKINDFMKSTGPKNSSGSRRGTARILRARPRYTHCLIRKCIPAPAGPGGNIRIGNPESNGKSFYRKIARRRGRRPHPNHYHPCDPPLPYLHQKCDPDSCLTRRAKRAGESEG